MGICCTTKDTMGSFDVKKGQTATRSHSSTYGRRWTYIGSTSGVSNTHMPFGH
jgi:hypothetical protein